MTTFAVLVLLRALLLLLIATAAVLTLRRSSAAVRAAVRTAAIACLVGLPVISPVVPNRRLAALPPQPSAAMPTATPTQTTPAVTSNVPAMPQRDRATTDAPGGRHS